MKQNPIISPFSVIHPTALIADGVTIEDGVYIGPYCIIGYPAEHRDHIGEPGTGVLIRKGARLTGACTIDAGTTRQTVIGENCFIMKGVHIGHDAVIFSGVVMAPGVRVGGHCFVMEDSNLGMNATLHQRTVIPAGVMIGQGSAVIKASQEILRPYYVYAGMPVRELRENTHRSDGVTPDQRIQAIENYDYYKILNHG